MSNTPDNLVPLLVDNEGNVIGIAQPNQKIQYLANYAYDVNGVVVGLINPKTKEVILLGNSVGVSQTVSAFTAAITPTDLSQGTIINTLLAGPLTLLNPVGSTVAQYVTYVLTQDANGSSPVTLPNGDVIPAWAANETRAFQIYFDGAELVPSYQSQQSSVSVGDQSIDGGSAASFYTLSQHLDGGIAASIYGSSQKIDGGNA